MGTFIYLPISRGLETKIDRETLDMLSATKNLKWNAQKSGKRFYVSKNTSSGGKVYLHRLIMNPTPGLCIDHINGDSLDNRKENLRVCSFRENSRNIRVDGFKGVTKENNKYAAQIQIDGNHINIGVFSTEGDAARAYDIVAAFVFKEYAAFNFDFSKKFIKYAK
jgi:hypothetical protein